MKTYRDGLNLTASAVKNGNTLNGAKNFIIASNLFTSSIIDNEFDNPEHIVTLLRKTSLCLQFSANIIIDKLENGETVKLKFGENQKNCKENITGNFSANLQNRKEDILEINTTKMYPEATLSDVVGMQEAKHALEEAMLWSMDDPELTVRKSILLFGPPGTGKSLIASAVANHYNWNFVNFSADNILDKFVGNTEKAIGMYFKYAQDHQPCIIFMDEIDNFAGKRNPNHDGPTHMKSVLLSQMSAIAVNTKIVVLACTNLPESLDDAFLRRFPIKIYVRLPTRDDRKEHFQKIISQYDHNVKQKHIETLCDLTNNSTGDEIANFITSCHMLCIRAHQQRTSSNSKGRRRIKLDAGILLDQILNHTPLTTDAKLFRFDQFHRANGGMMSQQDTIVEEDDNEHDSCDCLWNFFSSKIHSFNLRK